MDIRVSDETVFKCSSCDLWSRGVVYTGEDQMGATYMCHDCMQAAARAIRSAGKMMSISPASFNMEVVKK